MKQQRSPFRQLDLLFAAFLTAWIVSLFLLLYFDIRRIGFGFLVLFTLIALFMTGAVSLSLYGYFKKKAIEESTFDAFFSIVEGYAYIIFMFFFFWAWNNLEFPPNFEISLHGFGKDVPSLAAIKYRLTVIAVSYGVFTGVLSFVIWLLKEKERLGLEKIFYLMFAWILRPWRIPPTSHKMIERLKDPSTVPSLSLWSWRPHFNDSIAPLSIDSPILHIVRPAHLAFAGFAHLAITAIFLPEILRVLFQDWLGFVIGIMLIYFLFRWFTIFWSYFLLFDVYKRRFRREEERKPPIFGSLCAILSFILGVSYGLAAVLL